MEASQNELQKENRTKLEQLSSKSIEIRLIILNHMETVRLTQFLPFSDAIVDDYEKQIQELQQKLSEKEDERNVLNERLNEVELQLSKASEDQVSTVTKYELLIKQRDEIAEQHVLHSAER